MTNKGLKVGNRNDPIRIAARIQRLKQSIARAEGQHKAELEAELAEHEESLAAIKAALASVEA